MRLSGHGSTDVGGRVRNEDSLGVRSELGLFVVADGVGGREGGAVASELAVQVVEGFFDLAGPGSDLGFEQAFDARRSMAESRLEMVFRLAHKEVARRQRGPLAKMGTTLAVLLVRGAHAVIAHVGDSRIYRLRDGSLDRLTEDHSLYAELAAAGVTDLSERDSAAFGHMLTRAIGLEDNARPDVVTIDVQRGDRFLLCTDGLCGAVDDHVLEAILLAAHPDRAADLLVAEAIRVGTTDNVTAVVAHVE